MANNVAVRAAVWGFVVLLPAIPAPVTQADTLIRLNIDYSWKNGVEGDSTDEQTYWIGTDRARTDLGSVTHVVNRETGDLSTSTGRSGPTPPTRRPSPSRR